MYSALTCAVPPPAGARAFTRLELVAVLTALSLLSLVVLPVLANTKPRGDRMTCLNNLRRVGQAEHLWASDHNEQMPWWVAVSDGGTRGTNLQNNAWYNYGMMTNELATPTILTCPSDTETRVAHDFSSLADGFFHPGNKNNAVSYFIGLDSFMMEVSPYYNQTTGRLSNKALSGDRNLNPFIRNTTCASGVTVAAGVSNSQFGPPLPTVQWTNAIHGMVGNLVMSDGQVIQTSNNRVNQRIAPGIDDNGVYHLLLPR